MAADKVSAKIKADAQKRIREITAEFAERKKKLEAEHNERAASYREETKRLARSEAERIRREILSQARLSARREVLSARHELIQRSLDEAAKRFVKSSGYPALLGRMVREHGKGARVLLSAGDRRRFKSSAWARKADEAPIMGGLILRTPRWDVNFSLDAAFETMREELALELSRVLFTDSKPSKPTGKSRKKKK